MGTSPTNAVNSITSLGNTPSPVFTYGQPEYATIALFIIVALAFAFFWK